MGPEVDIRANQGHLWDKGMGFQEHTSAGRGGPGKGRGLGQVHSAGQIEVPESTW